MKISRFLKTIFMTDFIGGLFIATKELFKSKKTINYPFEKKDVLHVNYVKLFALLKLLLLSHHKEKMEAEKRLVMTLI